MPKMDGNIIGVDKRGFFDRKNDVLAKRLESGLTFEQAETLAKNRAGAEMLVATAGGRDFYGRPTPYKYDVFSVTIQNGDKEGKKIADNKVKFEMDPGYRAALVSPVQETFLYDENHSVRVFNRNGDYDKVRAAVEHVKSGDFGGARTLALTLSPGQLQTSLTQNIDQVVAAKADKEQAETRLKGDLAAAEKALEDKRAPYDQAVQLAESQYWSARRPVEAVLSEKQSALTEAKWPGYHAAARDVEDKKQNVSAANSGLERAERELKNAEGKVSKANDLEAERRTKKRELQGKLDEFPRVREQLRETDIKLNDYQKAKDYKQKFGEYPVGHDPNTGVPNTWQFGDSEWGLTATKRDLEQKLTQEPNLKRQIRELDDPSAEERRLREDGANEIRSAESSIRRAEQELGAAKARLTSAEDRFRNLPSGDPAKIQAAEKEVAVAQTAFDKAIAEPNRKYNEARANRDAAIQNEEAAVSALKDRLAKAPEGYEKALAELAKLAN